MIYTYICGQEFNNPQKFNGHKRHCDIHLQTKGTTNNELNNQMVAKTKATITDKYGSGENYQKIRSQKIKDTFKGRTDTFDYKIKSINKDEFIDLYINQNKPRKYMMEKYNISSYMMDKIIEHFNCHKDKKQSVKLGLQTQLEQYGPDNINNWKKGHNTRIQHFGTLKESYKQGKIKQEETCLKRYGQKCTLNLEYIQAHRKKKHSKPLK